MNRLAVAVAALAAALASGPIGCGREARPRGAGATTGELDAALQTITAAELLRHTEHLASDRFEGRAPGAPTEAAVVAYLGAELAAAGLAPGAADGTYVQAVPLAGLTTTGTATVRRAGRAHALVRGTDYLAVSRRIEPAIEVAASELVFVGHGIVAPEHGWDDYKDVDVTGKTIVMVAGEPPADALPRRGMTYYGRWTYKYEVAAAKGAAAAVILHDREAVGRPWAFVVGMWGGENLVIDAGDHNRGRAAVEAWMPFERARELFAPDHDLAALARTAGTRAFRPVALGATIDFRLANAVRRFRSANVIGRLPGGDPAVADEHVIYTAHWDHLGKDPTRDGDQIFNGAVDNATGTAALIEAAQAFAALRRRPRRSIVFLAVTAEEYGLLGARYYTTHPVHPLATALANLNIDGMNPWGRTADIAIVGGKGSSLDALVVAAARRQGRVVRRHPELDYLFFLSDQLEFARQGVPALFLDSGREYLGRPPGWGDAKRDAYSARHYHQVSDEVAADWDLAGAVEDVRLLVEVGWRVAEGDAWPTWDPGVEFRARRAAPAGAAPGGAAPR